MNKAMSIRKQGKNRKKKRLSMEDLQIFSFTIPAAILIFIFSYLPMWGIILAFQNFRSGDPLFSFVNVEWVGLRWFKEFIGSIYFLQVVSNTIRLSILHIAFGFTMPIVFALAINEIKNLRYKKLVQTASYMPYFISTVVVAGIVLSFLERNGIINNLLKVFGVEAKEWIVYPDYFPAIYTTTNVWATFGFGSILYFSTLSSIDPNLYEAAYIDGANRWQQMIHITLPSIMFVIAIQLILQIGHILHSNTTLILLLYRPSNYQASDTIGTYVYRTGILNGRYSYTSAVSLFMSVIGLLLTLFSNKISNRLTGYGLW